MENAILNPVSIYRYKRHVAPDGSMGTRWDCVGNEGQVQPDLFFTYKKTGEKAIYFGPQFGKDPGQGASVFSLRWIEKRRLVKNGKEILTNKASGFFEPDIRRPGCGYGDISNNRDAILIRKTETEMMIMVFPGQGKQAAVLFEQWGTGAVRESLPNNNIQFATVSVQPDPE